MKAATMCEYVRFCADRLLVDLKQPPAYNTPNPYPWMDRISVDTNANFFETRVSSYSVGHKKAKFEVGGDKNASTTPKKNIANTNSPGFFTCAWKAVSISLLLFTGIYLFWLYMLALIIVVAIFDSLPGTSWQDAPVSYWTSLGFLFFPIVATIVTYCVDKTKFNPKDEHFLSIYSPFL
jgi:hypothetical protein